MKASIESAKSADSVKGALRPVCEDYNLIRDAVDIFSLATGLSLQDVKEKLEEIKPENTSKDLDANCIRISLAGSFSCGKSSFINSLLGDEELAPVEPGPSTRVVTRFKYGESRKYLNSDGKEIDLEEYQNLAVQKRAEDDKTNVFSILTPAPFLRNIVLSDVPGFGSGDNSKADDEVSRKENENADIIFYLVNAKDGTIRKSDIEELVGDGRAKKGILNSGNKIKKLYVVVTHMDRIPSSKRDVIVKSDEDVLKMNGLDYKIYPYASRKEKIKENDKKLFEEKKQELCAEICFLAKCHNDVCEQRKKNRNLRKASKKKEKAEDIFKLIEASKDDWWKKYVSIKGIDLYVAEKKSFFDLKKTMDENWDEFEKVLNQKIKRIMFCKKTVKYELFNKYGVRKLEWQVELNRIVNECANKFISDYSVDKRLEPYFSISELNNVDLQVEELSCDYSIWQIFNGNSVKRHREKFAEEQNKNLQEKLFFKVKKCREQNIKRFETDFAPEFEKLKSIGKKFDTSYNQLLSSLRG